MKIILIIFVSTFIFYSNSFSCERTDPICVAATLYKKGGTFRTSEIKDFYCENNLGAWKFYTAFQSLAIAEFKEKGIDYLKNGRHDFSKLEYKLDVHDKNTATVTITGKATSEILGTDIKSEIEVNEEIFLTKENGTQKYCLPIEHVARGMKANK
jgi:hypothetical protein